jgi:hypothetical protein
MQLIEASLEAAGSGGGRRAYSRPRPEERRALSGAIQANRDNRCVIGPSTAHRIDGKKVPRKKLAGKKTQRELKQEDLKKALEVRS